MSDFSPYATPEPKPLPVIVMADVSGSMEKLGKIDALNASLTEMARSFAEESLQRGEILIAVVTFGGSQAEIAQRPVRAREFSWSSATAEGKTPMGKAFELVGNLLESKEDVPSRSYRPVLVLVSDGRPTDDWKSGLDVLNEGERASKAFRFAIRIGADADRAVLEAFVGPASGRVFEAHEASAISEFFQRITMSVTRGLQRGDYETVPALSDTDDDDTLDF